MSDSSLATEHGKRLTKAIEQIDQLSTF